jgi:hypothetical protein
MWKLGLGLVVATSGIIASSGGYVIASSGYNLLAQNPPPPSTIEPKRISHLSLKTLKCFMTSSYPEIVLIKVNDVTVWSSSMNPGDERHFEITRTVSGSAKIELFHRVGFQVRSLGEHWISTPTTTDNVLKFSNDGATYNLSIDAR